MSKSQHRVLEALADGEQIEVLSPAVLAFNLGYERETASRACSTLVDRGLVERVDEGYYRITDRGRAFIEGEIPPEALEDTAG